MLCDENGMASHWRLLPVVLRVGRCQPHANEILAMTADRIQALVRYVLPVRSRKAKVAPKLRSAEPQKCRIKCSLVRHVRRYTLSTSHLTFSTVNSVIPLPIWVDIIPNSPSLEVVRVRRRRPNAPPRGASANTPYPLARTFAPPPPHPPLRSQRPNQPRVVMTTFPILGFTHQPRSVRRRFRSVRRGERRCRCDYSQNLRRHVAPYGCGHRRQNEVVSP